MFSYDLSVGHGSLWGTTEQGAGVCGVLTPMGHWYLRGIGVCGVLTRRVPSFTEGTHEGKTTPETTFVANNSRRNGNLLYHGKDPWYQRQLFT